MPLIPPPDGRFRSLDGLRGVAALVVVVHHAMLTSPALAEVYRTEGAGEGWARLLAYSPLHLVWLGLEPVLVFFVLSGFVLALPALRSDRASWLAYYPKRLVRLYPPVWAAVAFAVVVALTVGRDDVPGVSWWLNGHDPITPTGIAKSLVLVLGTGDLNTVLWSLRWEVLFSLALPLYVGAAVLVARRWPAAGTPLAGAALLVLVVVGDLAGVAALQFLPVFGFGVLMAVERDRLAVAARAVSRVSAWPALAAVAATTLLADWLVHDLLGEISAGVEATVVVLRTVGVLLTVFVTMHWSSAVRATTGRRVQWLGSRSFSLYLLHEPIVVAVGFVLGGAGGPLAVLLIALPVSLLVAEVFFRLVERPSHRLARATGAWVPRPAAERAGWSSRPVAAAR